MAEYLESKKKVKAVVTCDSLFLIPVVGFLTILRSMKRIHPELYCNMLSSDKKQTVKSMWHTPYLNNRAGADLRFNKSHSVNSRMSTQWLFHKEIFNMS